MSASPLDKKITTQSSNSGLSPPFIKYWKNVPKPNPRRSTVYWPLKPRNSPMLIISFHPLFHSWSENQNHRSIWSTRDSAPTLNVNDDLRSSRRRTRFGKLTGIGFESTKLELLILTHIFISITSKFCANFRHLLSSSGYMQRVVTEII